MYFDNIKTYIWVLSKYVFPHYWNHKNRNLIFRRDPLARAGYHHQKATL